MRTTKVTDVLAGTGMYQRLYAEPTITEEQCSPEGYPCNTNWDCCPGLDCDTSALICWCYVC